MSLIPEIHLALASMALVLLALEDWISFEIAPQWAILAGVNVIAFNLSIGLNWVVIYQGFLIWLFGTIIVYALLQAFGRKNGIGRGDLYCLPIVGLVTTSDMLILGLYVLALSSVVFAVAFSWTRGKRGRRLLSSAVPLGPPFAFSMILVLTQRFIQTDYTPQIALPASWIIWLAGGVFLISLCAVLWRLIELTTDDRAEIIFPNPKDEDTQS